MAENKTEQFELNQWALTDPVRVEDFNADNRKIEAALLANQFVVGYYRGKNSYTDHTTIELPFKPSLVFIFEQKGSDKCSCAFSPDYPIMYNSTTIAAVTETGFTTRMVSASSTTVSPYVNGAHNYFYLAIR